MGASPAVLAAADDSVTRAQADAAIAMAAWEDARLLIATAFPDAIEHRDGVDIMRTPQAIPEGAPTRSDIRYTEADQAMVRAQEAVNELRALVRESGRAR